MSIKRVQDVIAYVQKIGARAAFNELRQCGVLRTNGEIRGRDRFGNTYWEDRSAQMCRDRWVVFADKASDPTTVPGEWHQWLHNMSDDPPEALAPERKFFQSEHEPTGTGTAFDAVSKAYTPHNYLYNSKFGKNYTAEPDVDEFSFTPKK